MGGSPAAAGCDGAAVDAGIQLADGVLASRDFSCVDLSRCVVVCVEPALGGALRMHTKHIPVGKCSCYTTCRCAVVVLSCSWVSAEDVCGLPVLASALMTAGAAAVVATTCNTPALARNDFLETL